MGSHKIKFYPVDNGDNTLIMLSDDTTILIDCKMRTSAEDKEDETKFDVKADLIKCLKKKNNNLFVDLFVLTHPDKDHCHGFKKHFYVGKPDDYSKENRENDEIIIEEMWVTSMLFNGASNDDAKVFKKEAERRRKLWDNDDVSKNEPGNRIRMIGYDGDDKFENVPSSIPGDIVSKINNSKKSNFEFFIHSPFKATLITATAEKDKNYSSIVLQARFKINSTDSEYAALVLLGGDADHNNWNEIYNKSEKHDNLDKLLWDIFLAPHHCSWTFFNDVPYGDPEATKTPKENSINILERKQKGGKIIASCKTIKDNEDNPPHYEAKKQYVKKLDSKEDFIELAKEPTEKAPEYVEFVITKNGPTKAPKKASTSALTSAGGAGAASTAIKQG